MEGNGPTAFVCVRFRKGHLVEADLRLPAFKENFGVCRWACPIILLLAKPTLHNFQMAVDLVLERAWGGYAGTRRNYRYPTRDHLTQAQHHIGAKKKTI